MMFATVLSAKESEREEREVALSIKAWNLNIANEVNTNLNLNLPLFFDATELPADTQPRVLSSGEFIAVVGGKPKEFQEVASLGRAALIMSAGGLVMKSQSLPLSFIRHKTTDFSLIVTPTILEKRKIVLDCDLNFSNIGHNYKQKMSLKMGQTLVIAGNLQNKLYIFTVSSESVKRKV
jgi:hypothetical protein